VDMLDTGIDIPEVVNLVFIKLVRSKTKFWQMVGRGTRLRKDLFGPGKDKAFFFILDYCQNLEFFAQNPATTDGALGESLGKRLFKTRLELISVLDRSAADPPAAAGARWVERHATYDAPSSAALRGEVASLLHAEVAAMNLDNFVVRSKRRLVERYAQPAAWTTLEEDSLTELAHEVAGLPSEQEPEDEEAKRFDLLMLNLQLAVLRVEPAFQRLSDQVKALAGLLEEKASIPMVQQQLALIQEIQSDEWWQDVTALMLEIARKRLRALVKLIDKQMRTRIYTDFEDQMGVESAVDLPGFAAPDSFERFRAKARAFLKEHEDHIAIHKLRMNKALTRSDLDELERMLTASGVGGDGDVQKAKEESHGLGLFVRSLVGLDREAAKQAFAGFLAGKTLNANQIEFVNLIVDHLTEHG
jgi:type I restriction enzyme, R subunit